MAVGAGTARAGQSWAISPPNVALTSVVGCPQTASTCLCSRAFSIMMHVYCWSPSPPGASRMVGWWVALGGTWSWDPSLPWVNPLCNSGHVLNSVTSVSL